MIRILIPAYNESRNIKNCVQGIKKVLDKSYPTKSLKKSPYRFYIVNDGSKDKTLSVLKSLSLTIPITIIDHPINQGVAVALRSGLKEITKDGSKEDIIFIMEGDGTSDPNLLPLMIDKTKGGCEIVIASRYVKGGTYKDFPFKRLLLSRSANLLLKLLFPHPNIKDYTIFYRAYQFSIIKKVTKSYKEKLLETKYFTANSELLIKMLKFAKNIGEVAYVYDYSKKKGRSGLKIKDNLWQYFIFIMRNKLL